MSEESTVDEFAKVFRHCLNHECNDCPLCKRECGGLRNIINKVLNILGSLSNENKALRSENKVLNERLAAALAENTKLADKVSELRGYWKSSEESLDHKQMILDRIEEIDEYAVHQALREFDDSCETERDYENA